MKALILLVTCQLVAAIVVLGLGRLWLQIDAEGSNSMLAGLIIGLLAVLASVVVPITIFRRI